MSACPRNCGVDLLMAERQGIQIDYCPKCRGVWLDHGELEKIMEREAAYDRERSMSHEQRARQEMDQLMPPPGARPPQPHQPSQPYPSQSRDQWRDTSYGYYGGKYGHRGKYGHKHKRGLRGIFDIFD